jgi:hypothetical protein
MEKNCTECGTLLRGRVDKKFCSDQCRSAHNNKLKSDDTNYIRNINNTLRRNRKILLDLNPNGKVKVSRQKLMSKGFDFSLHTSTYTTREGAQYHYCYEQGYVSIEKDWVLLVTKKDLEW